MILRAPRVLVATLGLLLAGCVATPVPSPTSEGPAAPRGAVPDRVTEATAVANFRAAVARTEPAAERVCREQTQGINCDFLIRVLPDRSLPPNAFQSLDRSGRPILTFTQSLIADARNADEIAFVVGHEAAHHIEQHIAQQVRSAQAGALIGGLVGTLAGGDGALVDTLSRAGATAGARRFSKEHELEADALGTVITARAGYDPVRGAAFFSRIPDPGDQFLGTHPPNAERLATVRRAASRL
ncbi:M48 family metallopeptidase [Jannaschia aquimarina]|uniref:YfgC_1 protein n=1 Tax=Jannaschia aquimarina TaxID=935700 RepID=A0A0D1CNV5_9RHOB|nr:M48 family metallopeptidase [Jannaschia aquimarina]KIT16422.1 TPR repeat-containing protein YfgC precursor [Jannaschia aquimarina]SNS91916.1 Peptidase family M48 [Jannaschia aquimarina]